MERAKQQLRDTQLMSGQQLAQLGQLETKQDRLEEEGRRGRQQLATSQARTQQLEAELAQAREQQAGLQV